MSEKNKFRLVEDFEKKIVVFVPEKVSVEAWFCIRKKKNGFLSKGKNFRAILLAALTIFRSFATSSIFLSFQPIVIDAKGHLLGRLSSILAKTLLQGKMLVLLESAVLSRVMIKEATHFTVKRQERYILPTE